MLVFFQNAFSINIERKHKASLTVAASYRTYQRILCLCNDTTTHVISDACKLYTESSLSIEMLQIDINLILKKSSMFRVYYNGTQTEYVL